jgi:FixJ family two-component response regulator
MSSVLVLMLYAYIYLENNNLSESIMIHSGSPLRVATGGTRLQQVYIVNRDPVSNSITRRMLADVEIQSREFLVPGELLQALPLASPACFLIDFILPEMNGLQLMRMLRRADAHQPCVITSTRIDPEQVVSAMNQGAFGFLKKPFQQIELLDMVQRALNRDHAVHKYIDLALSYRNRRNTLSSRERHILEFLERGQPASEVGNLLRISHRTVENHRAQILRKLELVNSNQLTRLVALLDVLRASGLLE